MDMKYLNIPYLSNTPQTYLKSSTPSTPAVFGGAVFGAVPGLVRSDPKTPRKWRCQAMVDDGDIV